MGDSFVFGFGVNNDKAIPFLLETKLNEKLNENKFEVLNLGVPGHNFTIENKYFDRFKKFEPDIVLIGTNVTDFTHYQKDDCFSINNFKCLIRTPGCLDPKEKSFFDLKLTVDALFNEYFSSSFAEKYLE